CPAKNLLHMKPVIMRSSHKLVLVANPEPFHVGGHLLAAGRRLGMETTLVDVQQAYAGNSWARRLNWWLRGRRPHRLRAFSQDVTRVCQELRPRWLLATGIAPLTDATLRVIGRLGVQRLCFLTDDPWNPAQRAPWFLRALSFYDAVFTPRRDNL